MESIASSSEDGLPPVQMVKFRAAWPCLRPLPLRSVPGSKLPIDIRDKRFEIFVGACGKLREHCGLWLYQIHGIHVTYLEMPDEPLTRVPTVFIRATWNNDRSRLTWPRAVRDIVILTRDLLNGRTDFHVDMVANEMVSPIYISPPAQNPHLANDWPHIRDCVYRRLESFEATNSHTTSITLMARGYQREPISNPITVFITLDPESKQADWGDVLEDIKGHVDSIGWGNLHIHMEHGVCDSFTLKQEKPLGIRKDTQEAFGRDPHTRGDYNDKIQPTDIIANSSSFNGNAAPSATLGCLIQVNTEVDKGWHQYALTSYEVARPSFGGYTRSIGNASHPDGQRRHFTEAEIQWMCMLRQEKMPKEGTDLWNTDKRGYWLSGPANLTTMESPSRLRHEFSMACFDQDMKMIEDRVTKRTCDRIAISAHDDLKDRKSRRERFFKQGRHQLGQVIACSGNRLADDNNRLDWAVVDIGKRTGHNILPPHPTPFPPGLTCPIPCGLLPQCIMASGITLRHPNPETTLHSMPSGTNLWKAGNRTGVTSGIFSSYRSLCRVGRQMSEEYVVFGGGPNCRDSLDPEKRFAKAGDAGSVVFNRQGEVVGLLTAGQKPLNNQAGYVFVTPIENVFDDIRKCSNDYITDVRIARG
ncbi:hypothetical protein FSARC_8979 [Fusarium sarcochroum]|uniref:Uncharacterized protein n=1 Tax=Fusarium sarcochroum TaxID=1208366 RepID=A0A8H4TRR9_9HYPO|nr:hypothetical protein FSARC_8979 [Fusarium sarcochroum]